MDLEKRQIEIEEELIAAGAPVCGLAPGTPEWHREIVAIAGCVSCAEYDVWAARANPAYVDAGGANYHTTPITVGAELAWEFRPAESQAIYERIQTRGY